MCSLSFQSDNVVFYDLKVRMDGLFSLKSFLFLIGQVRLVSCRKAQRYPDFLNLRLCSVTNVASEKGHFLYSFLSVPTPPFDSFRFSNDEDPFFILDSSFSASSFAGQPTELFSLSIVGFFFHLPSFFHFILSVFLHSSFPLSLW